MSGCNHTFCFPCAANWRKIGSASQQWYIPFRFPTAPLAGVLFVSLVWNILTVDSPLCRAYSDKITPSSTFYPRGADREKYMKAHKKYLTTTPCRYFSKNEMCPNLNSCGFAHLKDGKPFKFSPKELRHFRRQKHKKFSDLESERKKARGFVLARRQRRRDSPPAQSTTTPLEPNTATPTQPAAATNAPTPTAPIPTAPAPIPTTRTNPRRRNRRRTTARPSQTTIANLLQPEHIFTPRQRRDLIARLREVLVPFAESDDIALRQMWTDAVHIAAELNQRNLTDERLRQLGMAVNQADIAMNSGHFPVPHNEVVRTGDVNPELENDHLDFTMLNMLLELMNDDNVELQFEAYNQFLELDATLVDDEWDPDILLSDLGFEPGQELNILDQDQRQGVEMNENEDGENGEGSNENSNENEEEMTVVDTSTNPIAPSNTTTTSTGIDDEMREVRNRRWEELRRRMGYSRP